ncbi:MAG: NAD(P)/FAD-dependent oxidoreductase [Patescibacteria group bacterium]|jgi:protoporphyrinogen oxidase
MKIAFVGGGITSLTAALLLSQKGHLVTVFEKENALGGLASGFKAPKWNWSLERYYHHFFDSDQELKNLAAKLGLSDKLFFKKPKTSIFVEGEIFRFDDPQSILQFPKLNFIDKIRTGVTSVFLKINPFWGPLERIPANRFINKTMGKTVNSIIWEPLLASKFGDFAQQIPASWFWTRIKKRSFQLGYFQGGTKTLIDCLKDKIEKNGGEILLNKSVTQIKKKNKSFELVADGKKVVGIFDQVIVTTSPSGLAKIVPQLSPEEKTKIEKLKSLGSLCLVLELKDKFLVDGTYWLNINDKSFPFVAVVEHTNYIDKKHYGRNHIVYVGGYYPSSHKFFKMNKENIFSKFLPYLKKINPYFESKSALVNLWLFKDYYSQPVVSLNYSKDLPSVKTSIDGLYWGSLHHVYPQDRGVNYAVALGRRITNEIDPL